MSVRLEPETEALIRRIAKTAGKSKSWVVREAVAVYASQHPVRQSPYETLAPFVGAGDTGRTDLSERTGERFSKLVGAKSRARRSR